MTQEYFVEIFPIVTAAVPPLYAFRLQGENTGAIGGKLAYALKKQYEGHWLWSGGRLVTDAPITPAQMDITLDQLRKRQPKLYKGLESAHEDERWQPTPLLLAEYVLQGPLRDLEPYFAQALATTTVQLKNLRVERTPRLRAQQVGDRPSISISFHSRLVYNLDLRTVALGVEKPRELVGLWVMDATADDRLNALVGEIVKIVGPLSKHRDKLLSLTRRPKMQQLIRAAPDEELVVRVQSRRNTYDYVAGALQVLIRPDSREDIERFGIDAEQALRALHMRPSYRASLVRAVSDIAKKAGILDSAYNSRTVPQAFAPMNTAFDIEFDGNRIRPFSRETLADEFGRYGVYHCRARFYDEPIRIAMINTLPDAPIDDFIEAMRRLLERQYGFKIELVKERKVKKVSSTNLERAVKAIAKEQADIVLAFFPDVAELDTDEDEDYRRVKAMALRMGMASHIIRRSALDRPELMPVVIMGLLGKTGNTPFVFSTPLPYADFVVGLDIVRTVKKGGQTITAAARIYNQRGQLVRYKLATETLAQDEPVPLILMQRLFPLETFAKKRVVVHHDGLLQREWRDLLMDWAARGLQATFSPVEIFRRGVPRLYMLRKKSILSPPWGAVFRLNPREALLVSSVASEHMMPRPLLLRLDEAAAISLDDALHSVLGWTLLHYGMARSPRLPVTIAHAGQLAAWLEKGANLPEESDVPFWL